VKISKGIAVGLALLAGAMVLLGSCQKKDDGKAATDSVVVMRLAETHPEDYPTTKGDYKFAELVKERTNGRVVIKVYSGSQLGQEKAVIENVQMGAIDFTRVSLSPVSAFAPQMNALQMPYLYRDVEHMWKVLNGDIGQGLLDSLDSAGFVGLGWFESGARNFYNSKRVVEKPEDLVGLKIRVQENELMMGLVNAFGAVATPMPYGEVYSGLQTGVIDGAENNWPSYYSTSHYEVAKFLTIDEHTRVPEIIIGSKISMSKLSLEDQAIIQQAAKDAVAYQRAEWDAYEKLSEEKVRAAGNTVTIISDVAPWQAKMAPLYARQSAEVQEMIKKIQAVQ
jgi:tripartite ATP-independent transporter DctP family solute receptor